MKINIFYVKWVILFTIILLSCKKENFEQEKTNEQKVNEIDYSIVTSETSEDLMEFAIAKPNPYTLTNMQRALDTFAVHNTSNFDLTRFNVRATHKYIKFKPQDTAQLDILLLDTSLILFDYPLHRKIVKGGTYYRDPTLTGSQINYLWTSVPANKILPANIPYDVISDLYIPEQDPNLVQYYNTSFDNSITKLIEVALIQTGNDDTTSHGNLTAWWWNIPKWQPAGNISRFDDRINAAVPLEGAQVRARRWFTTYVSNTDIQGNFRMNGQFRYRANYSIKWDRGFFNIRSGLLGQAYYNGPKQRGDWNLNIGSGKSQFFAHIHRACIDYYDYANSQFSLRSLPRNRRMNIAAHSHMAPSNGVHGLVPIYPQIQIWNPGRRADFIYGTTIHELTHYSHSQWGLVSYITAPDKLSESWAEGVEFVFARWRYGTYGDRTTNPVTSGTDWYQNRLLSGISLRYTSIVVDLIDDEDQRNTRGRTNDIRYPRDIVSGYTIEQIENSIERFGIMNIIPTSGTTALPTNFISTLYWQAWEDNLRNMYNNPTEQNLPSLFDNWP